MIKHILTNDAILVPTAKGTLQYSRISKICDRVLEILQSSDNVADLEKLGAIFYEDDEITINQDKDSEVIEVFHNGKYFDLDDRLTKEFCKLIALNDGFEIEHGANFLKKLLNSRIDFDALLDILYQIGFSFTSEGDIVIMKEYEEEGYNEYFKLRTHVKGDKIKGSYCIVDPTILDVDMSFDVYRIIGHYLGKPDQRRYIQYLTGTHLGSKASLTKMFSHHHFDGFNTEEAYNNLEKTFKVKHIPYDSFDLKEEVMASILRRLS